MVNGSKALGDADGHLTSTGAGACLAGTGVCATAVGVAAVLVNWSESNSFHV